MPCSRMPKWKLRPSNDERPIAAESLIQVLVDGSRSALPPTSVGTSAAARLQHRVAVRARRGRAGGGGAHQLLGPVRGALALDQRTPARLVLGAAPRASSRTARCQASCSTRTSAARAANRSRTSGGTRNDGDSGQPSARLAAASSSAPSGSPCAERGVLLVRRAVARCGCGTPPGSDDPPRRARDSGRARARPGRTDSRARRASRRPRSAAATSSVNASAVSPSMVM